MFGIDNTDITDILTIDHLRVFGLSSALRLTDGCKCT